MEGYMYIFLYVGHVLRIYFVVCCGLHSENAWIPNGWMCLFLCAGRRFVFGNYPKYKWDSVRVSWKMCDKRFARGLVPYAPVMALVRSWHKIISKRYSKESHSVQTMLNNPILTTISKKIHQIPLYRLRGKETILHNVYCNIPNFCLS